MHVLADHPEWTPDKLKQFLASNIIDDLEDPISYEFQDAEDAEQDL
jgi:hypothetical protein